MLLEAEQGYFPWDPWVNVSPQLSYVAPGVGDNPLVLGGKAGSALLKIFPLLLTTHQESSKGETPQLCCTSFPPCSSHRAGTMTKNARTRAKQNYCSNNY